MGQSPPSSAYNLEGAGLPFFQGKVDFGLRNPVPRVWCSTPLKIAEAGDVLLSVRAPVGAVNIASETCCIGRGLAALRAGAKVEPEFLFFHLMSRAAELDSLGTGAIFKAINRDTLRTVELGLPSKSEQFAIAGVLTALQKAVGVEAKRVGALKALKAATMAKLLREGLNGDNLKGTEIGDIPVGWRVARLGDVATLYSGGTPPKNNATYWSGPIPWVSPKDMKVERLLDVEDHISEDAAKNFSRIVPAGTVFVVVRGMVLAKSFPVAIAEKPMAFNQDMKALIAREGMDPDFLLFAVLGRSGDLTAEIGTSAHGTRRIGSNSLESFLLPVPPIEEQKAIGFMLSSLERRVQAAAARKEILAAAFSAALQMLMTGQLRVLPLLESLAAPHE